MPSEKKTAAAPAVPALRLHHWLDTGGLTVCRNCGQPAGVTTYCKAPGETPGDVDALRAEVDRLKSENTDLRSRLADAELQPLQKRGK
jgi:hypothetical protein